MSAASSADSASPSPSPFAPLHAKLEATRLLMADSIATALDNSTQLESIEQQSADLEQTAGRFRRETTDLRRKMFWKNVQMKAAIGCGVLLALGACAGILYGLVATQH